jgi:zinc protease
MKRFTSLLVALPLGLLPAALPAQPASLSAPAPAELTLTNGLSVVLADDALATGAAVAVEYAVGHADDPASHRGLSHLLEHLTFRGSTHLRAFETDDILGELAAGYQGFTSLERTVYLTALPARALETVLWIESERMAFTLGRLDETALELEKRVVTNELREREQTRSFVLWRRRQQALYGASHPFTPAADAARAVNAVDLQGLQGFFQRTYRPDNARLIITGQFQRELARTWVEKYFAGIRSSPLPRTRVSAAPPRLCGVHRLDVGHPFLLGRTQSFSWVVPASPDAAERTAFEVLRIVLEARLESILVHERFLAGSVSAGVARHRTHGLFSLEIEMQDTEVWDAARNIALREVVRITEQPISSEELSNARSRLISRYVFDRPDAASRALALVLGEDPDAERAAIVRVDPAAVLAAARPLRGSAFEMTGRPEPGASVEGVVLHESNSCR